MFKLLSKEVVIKIPLPALALLLAVLVLLSKL